MTIDYLLSGYDYNLPPELIAQNPAMPRDSSRLLVVDSPTTHIHSTFAHLFKYLLPGDLLVFNNTRVIPARLLGYIATGAPIEILLLEEKHQNCWLALVKPGKRFKLGAELCFYSTTDEMKNKNCFLKAKVIEQDRVTGGRILQFQLSDEQSFEQVLEQFGQIPFPPYITHSQADPSQYQTIYAKQLGAVAAPTAGLHFTEELFKCLQNKGIDQAYLTLHVGIGTFRSVEVADITQHLMYPEWVEIPKATAEKVTQTKASGGRVIAVGTTVVRALEGAIKAQNKPKLSAFRGKTEIFIYPGYQWRVIDGLITNFHLPRSSLLMLISALIGRERLLSLYQEAIRERYRFYSFGDAMLILPAGVNPYDVGYSANTGKGNYRD